MNPIMQKVQAIVNRWQLFPAEWKLKHWFNHHKHKSSNTNVWVIEGRDLSESFNQHIYTGH